MKTTTSISRFGGLRFPTSLHSVACLCSTAALLIFNHLSIAQTWQTVDDYQYMAGQAAANYSLTIGPNGALFAAGSGDDTNATHALVKASVDGGITWSAPLDDYTNAAYYAQYSAVASDAVGNLYACGIYGDESDCGNNHWLVRRSADGGATWSTVDDLTTGNGTTCDFDTAARGVGADASGNVYVAGLYGANWTVRKGIGGANFVTVDSFPANNNSVFGSALVGAYAVFVHPTAGVFAVGQARPIGGGTAVRAWLVRRSQDGGAAWTTVDTLYGTKGQTSYYGHANSIGADTHGNLYVAGALAIPYKSGGVWEWVVRKSANAGNSWNTVDTYQFSTSGSSLATAFISDTHGNLFVAGQGAGTTGGNHWLVRENPGGTGSWSTVDNFQYASGSDTVPNAIAVNASGNVLVGGYGSATNNQHWLVRRK
jgi:hypothetical protein